MEQLNNNIELPQPDEDALRQSQALLDTIKNQLHDNNDVLTFDQYMSIVLYEPGLGYYSAGSRKFGEAGDFVTAPEISPLFSQCLARQCQQVLMETNQPILLELGAGTGVMAADILSELKSLDTLPEAYWIMEPSADLRQRQQTLLKDRLPSYFANIRWLDQLPEEQFEGMILGNEVIDALPVQRFIKTSGSFSELGVGLQDDQLTWVELTVEPVLLRKLEELEAGLAWEFPDGFQFELNTTMPDWLAAITQSLDRGIVLFLDYGYPRKEYYHPDRSEGTLMCHYRHRAHADPFYYPGLQDITTSVDFTWLAESAVELGLDVKGYTTQAYFLLATGLENLIANDTGDIRLQMQQAQQIRTLTLPGEMGERIKVMALGRDISLPLTGFSLMDQRVRL